MQVGSSDLRRPGAHPPSTYVTSITLCLQDHRPRPGMLSHAMPKGNRPTRTKSPHFPKIIGLPQSSSTKAETFLPKPFLEEPIC